MWPMFSSLECDTDNRLLYLADLSTKSIKMIDYEGKRLRTIVEKQNLAVSRPISLTLYENKALVLNMASSTVGQCKLYGEYDCHLLELNVRNSYQLLVVQESRQPLVSDSCNPDKINCSLVCVPTENGGKCICHNGEHVREGDKCPKISNRALTLDPLFGAHQPEFSDPDAHHSEPPSATNIFLNIFLALTVLGLVVAALGYIYKRRFHRKFTVGMHFHNPELSTVDAAEVKMFQGAPKLHQTETLTELTLETPPLCGTSSNPSSSETVITQRQLDITTTAMELENMSDADSMKDAYDCGDDPRQRLIM